MNEVGAWFREQGMQAARAGFGHGDFPFSLDGYGTLPPILLRQNPSYYHSLLKESGFESERGWVDYKIEVTPDLVARWRGFLDDARGRGFDIVPLRDISPDRRVDDFNDAWNEAFSQHWGVAPQSREERSELFDTLGPLGMFDVSVIAYENDEPVGTLWVAPELASVMAATASGRALHDDEKVNFLGIGVRDRARSKGVNLAMAAYAYLALVERGARFLSYTLVLDDNWPSRRTAEKLGAYVCSNYMVYRRNFVRPG
jgi:GNAT superfamily N-acetyltransferase